MTKALNQSTAKPSIAIVESQTLALLLQCAEAHVEGIATGVVDQASSASKDQDLQAKRQAIATAKAQTYPADLNNDEEVIRTVVLPATCTTDRADPPLFCAFGASQTLLTKISSLSLVAQAMNLTQIRFDCYADSWGNEEIETAAKLNDACIVVCKDGSFWFEDLAERYNAHFQSEVVWPETILNLLHASDDRVVFYDEDVQQAYEQENEACSNG